MSGDSAPEIKFEKPETAAESETARKLLSEAGHKNPAALRSLDSSNLLAPAEKEGLSVESRQWLADFAGTMSAGLAGTAAWSVADKSFTGSRYGLLAKAAAAFVAGGLTRFGVRGGSEFLMLKPEEHKSGLADLAWGGVDALAAVGAVKSEQLVSSAWKAQLGKSSGAHLSREFLEKQGQKLLEADLKQRILHNGLRGLAGGGTGGLLWSTPHELAKNSDQLNSFEGWKKSARGVAESSLFGMGFGGFIGSSATALWNTRELAGMSRAVLEGKRGRFSLDIYHFNDGHSSVLGERASLPQLAGKAESLREASRNSGRSSLLFELGDAHSGNAASVVSKSGELEQSIIHKHLKADASIPGNHIVDTGVRGAEPDAAKWIEVTRAINSDLKSGGREFPGLAANVKTLLEPDFTAEAGIYKPYRIYQDPQSGEKVGLVGLVTDTLQSASPKLIEGQTAATLAKYGKLSFEEFRDQAAHDPASRALLEQISENPQLKKLMIDNPQSKLYEAAEVLMKEQLDKMSPEAQSRWKELFTVAAKEPEATLAELSARHQESKTIQQLASLYPTKRISELNQVMVSDPEEALRKASKALADDGVYKIIVLSHMGRSADIKLAKEGPRVAAIIGGHSHDLEPKPYFARNSATGADVLVTQAGSRFGWLGETNLVFNKDGSLNRYLSSGKMHVIDKNVAAMPAAKDTVLRHMESSEEGRKLLEQTTLRYPIKVEKEISMQNIRGQLGKQTPLANLVVEALKEGGDKILPSLNAGRKAAGMPALADSVEAVLIQSGGIREGLPAGQLDELTLQTMFMNRAALVELSGSEIKKALAYGVHDMPAASAQQGWFNKSKELLNSFLKEEAPLAGKDLSGKNVITGQLRFKTDRSLPTYDRVRDVEILDRLSGNYVPLADDKRYTVLTVTHLLRRMANTPLVSAAEQNSIPAKNLGANYWVFGKEMDPSSALSMLKPSTLPDNASRDFLLDYLQSRSKNGRFMPPDSLRVSPFSDTSPGAWIPTLRPSALSSSLIGSLSAQENRR